MTKKVLTVTMRETLKGLLERFIRFNVHVFPVVDEGGRIVGIVSYEDMMKIFAPHDPALKNLLDSIHLLKPKEEDILEAELASGLGEKITVSEIMNTNVVTIEEDLTIAEARALMRSHGVERLPVVKDEVVTGIITLFNIVVAVFKRKNIIE